MKNNILLLYKQLGETPLDTITRYKQKERNTNQILSFAGRLDPMAEGLLLVLINDENKKRKEYEDLPKTYQFTFLTGIATDSFDLLGLVTKETKKTLNIPEIKTELEKAVPSLVGKKIMSYPPYSSYHVKGKPLYYLARRGELPHPLPTKEVTIFDACILEHSVIQKSLLRDEILQRISLVQGNFRQEAIKQRWIDTLQDTRHEEFLLTHAKVTCTSGTYVRQLVQMIGEEIDLPTVTFSIKRTAIGSYTLSDIIWFS